jgi:hypothetical protein
VAKSQRKPQGQHFVWAKISLVKMAANGQVLQGGSTSDFAQVLQQQSGSLY